MVRRLRGPAFALLMLAAIAAIYPYNAADTYAAERITHRVTLVDGNTAATHETTAQTVGAFLEEQGITLGTNDNLTPHYRRRLENRLTIEIDRAFYIDLVIDGRREQKEVSPGTTSGEILRVLQRESEMAMLLDGSEEEVLDKDSVLTLSTWRSEVRREVESIPYTSEYYITPSLSMGVEQVRREGIEGERQIEYEVIYIGSEEYAREILDEFILEPTSRIVDKGVGGNLGTLTDTSCPSFHYVRRVTMNASAYTAGPCCTGKGPGHPLYGVTASGRMVEHGIVAVDPRVIPLGTRLYVEGYGFALAADTGGAIRGYKIDLFMYDLADARRFGRRDVTVFILD